MKKKAHGKSVEKIIGGKTPQNAETALLKSLKVEPNDPAQRGQYASLSALFGETSRYKLFAVHTRFDAVQWMVEDAENMVDAGAGIKFPAVIAQENDPLTAIAVARSQAPSFGSFADTLRAALSE